MLSPEAPSSELGRQAPCQSLDVQSNGPACSSCLGPESEGCREWAGQGLGMPGPGCLSPLGVRNALPGGAWKGTLPAPHTSAQTSPWGRVPGGRGIASLSRAGLGAPAGRLAGGQRGSQALLVTLCLGWVGCLASPLPDHPWASAPSLTGARGELLPVGKEYLSLGAEGPGSRFVLPQGTISFPSLSCECLICKMGQQLSQHPPGLLGEKVGSFFERAS